MAKGWTEEYTCKGCDVTRFHYYKEQQQACGDASLVSLAGKTVGYVGTPYGEVLVTGKNADNVKLVLAMHQRNALRVSKR